MAADMSRQYMNTMVFAVVAAIVSMMLLLLIMRSSDTVRRYSAFVITLEVGLVFIILVAVTRIIQFENKKLKSSRVGYNNTLSVKTCPDFWTNVDGNMCVNSFNATDRPYTYRISGFDPTPGTPSATNLTQTIQLKDFDGKSIVNACAQAKMTVKGPWADVKAVCDSYRL